MTIWMHEMKMNRKTLVIWSVCVGISCFGCLLLFGGLEDTMEQMAESYAQMGAFSAALGLDRISVATIEGFYATEVALIFAIGGAMFAAMTGAGMLAKEEEGHTTEFLYTLPLGRISILAEKYAAMCGLVVLFHLVCVGWILAGFLCAGEMPSGKAFLFFHGTQLFMELELGSVCFLASAFCKRKPVGAALGLAVFLYMADLLCRILPDLEWMKYVTPYYYSNAADIFTGTKADGIIFGLHGIILGASAVLAATVYRKKDLAV